MSHQLQPFFQSLVQFLTLACALGLPLIVALLAGRRMVQSRSVNVAFYAMVCFGALFALSLSAPIFVTAQPLGARALLPGAMSLAMWLTTRAITQSGHAPAYRSRKTAPRRRLWMLPSPF